MAYFPFVSYSFVKFEKSKSLGKKYDAILLNKKTERTSRVPFGQLGYEQYKDSTGLGLYTHMNHLDPRRRTSYKLRHAGDIKTGNYSAGYFSMKYLW